MAKELKFAEELKLNAIYVSMYKKAGKNPGDPATTNFIYKLSGGAEALARYKAIKDEGGFYREDEDGNPLFFTNVHHNATCDVTITRTGAVVVANDHLEAMQSKLKLVTDPAVRQAGAQIIAQQIFGGLVMPSAAPAVQSAPSAEVEAPAEDEQPALGE